MDGTRMPEIWEQHFHCAWSELELLLDRSGAATAVLLDTSGNPLTYAGEDPDFDLSCFASLAVGDWMAARAMAELFEDRTTRWVVHEGTKDGMVLAPLHPSLLLAVVFDGRTTLGLVRHEIRRKRQRLAVLTEPLLALVDGRLREFQDGDDGPPPEGENDERDLIGEGLEQLFGPSV